MFSLHHVLRPALAALLTAGLLIDPATLSGVAWARPAAVAAVPAAVTVPVRVQSGHVYVDVEIDGKGPFHFLLDTGAPNVLTPAAAKRLGLAVRGNLAATGTGGVQAGGTTKVALVRVGEATLTDQTFYVLELPPGTSDEAPVDGLIGFEWLNRFVTRLDYAGATLTFGTDMGGRQAGSAAPSRLSFRGRLPLVDGKIDGLPGRFSIDTGSSGSLTLSSPFVAAHDFANRYHARTRVMAARGIGGPVYALASRAELLEFGTATAKRPVTFLSQQRAGTTARNDTAGNIGFGVLRQFTITFDYPHKQITFEPNANWGQPDLADRSGLRLERSDAGFAVAFVAEGSPAAQAGIRAGDHVIAVNVVPAATLAMDKVRGLLKGPVGTRVSLTLDHGPVIIALADL